MWFQPVGNNSSLLIIHFQTLKPVKCGISIMVYIAYHRIFPPASTFGQCNHVRVYDKKARHNIFIQYFKSSSLAH